MHPVLLNINGLKITSYGFTLMLAFLLCNYLLKKYLKSIDIDQKIGDDIIFYAALGGILGAKIYYIVEFWSSGEGYNNILGLFDIGKGIISFDFSLIALGINQFGSGLVFLGGLIGGLLLVTIYIYKNNLNWSAVSDWVAPYLILGHAIGRIGCFLVGDCYGKPCSLPWAVTFKNGLPPTTYESFNLNYPNIFYNYVEPIYNPGDLISVHPTQLYETFIYVIIFIYLLYSRSRKKYNSEIFLEYLFLAGLARFFIEFFRVNPLYYFDLSGAQFISLLMILVSSLLMYLNRKKYINGNS